MVLALLLPASARGGMPDLPVQRHVLDNGLTLLILPRHHAPVFSAMILFKVGSVDEPPGASGVAHLYEHMAFKGTRTLGALDIDRELALLDRIDRLRAERRSLEQENAPETADRRLRLDAEIEAVTLEAEGLAEANVLTSLYERNGAVQLNASTSHDHTQFFVSLPNNRLPLWAALESDRIANPVLRGFYKERDVVLEERNSRVETNPHGMLAEVFRSAAFVAHPYGTPVIGWKSEVSHLTRAQAAAFYNSHYVPANMIIALVGDLDPEQALSVVRDSFGKLPAVPPPAGPITEEPTPPGERHVMVRWDAKPRMLIGFPLPAGGHPHDAAISALETILANGKSGRLYRSLVVERDVASRISVGSGNPGYRYPNLFTISAIPRLGNTPEAVERAILEEIEKLTREPVSRIELETAVNQVEAGLVRSLSSNMGMARLLANMEALTGDWGYLFRLYEEMGRLTPEKVRQVAARYFIPKRRTVAVLLPESDAATGGAVGEGP